MTGATAPLFFGTIGWFVTAALTWCAVGRPGPLARSHAAAALAAAGLGMALASLLVLFMGERLEESYLWIFVLFLFGVAAALMEFVRVCERPAESPRWPAWVVPAVTLSLAATVPLLEGILQYLGGGLVAGAAWLAAAWRLWRGRPSGASRLIRGAYVALGAGMLATVPVPLLGLQPVAPGLAWCGGVAAWVLAVSLSLIVWPASSGLRWLIGGLGGLLGLLAVAGPGAADGLLGLAEQRADDEMKQAIVVAAARIPPTQVQEPIDAAGLTESLRATVQKAAPVRQALVGAVTEAELWTADDRGQRRRLAAVGEGIAGPEPHERVLTAEEWTGRASRAAFRAIRANGNPVWNAPLPYTGVGGVWLAWEMPAAVWAQRFEVLRTTGLGVATLIAMLAATGLALGWRQALERERTLALQRSEAASRAKSEFLAFLGHELRTPLQVILGRAELLRGQPGEHPEADEIALHSRIMLRQVNDLLDLGTIEAGKLQLQPATVALQPLLEAAVAAVRASAMSKGLAVRLIVAPDLPKWIRADEARLLQVLSNVIGNAVRYTATGGVELAVERAMVAEATDAGRAALRFTVRDTGIGLPEDKIPQLFTMFTRLDSGSAFSREGTGLGLALVQRLVAIMGGEVRAANRADGVKGAEFTIDLVFPLAAAPVADTGAGETARGSRVLVAEDNPAIAALFADYLQLLGAAVEVARDGRAALARAESGEFDLVLLDINLPGLDGVEVARELSASGHGRPRLIGCSAEVLPETQAAARAAGMETVLTKPVALEELRRVLRKPAAEASIFTAIQAHPVSARVRELALEDRVASVAWLRSAVARRDTTAVLGLVHRLRSTARVLQDAELERAVEELAVAAQAGEWDAATRMAVALRA